MSFLERPHGSFWRQPAYFVIMVWWNVGDTQQPAAEEWFAHKETHWILVLFIYLFDSHCFSIALLPFLEVFSIPSKATRFDITFQNVLVFCCIHVARMFFLFYFVNGAVLGAFLWAASVFLLESVLVCLIWGLEHTPYAEMNAQEHLCCVLIISKKSCYIVVTVH